MKINSSKTFKALLVAGLLAAPCLAFNAMAQNREDDHWSPLEINTDANGLEYAYWSDPNNWSLAEVPLVYDTNAASPTFFNAAFDSAAVECFVTNDVSVGQLMCGFGGGGILVITNGAQFLSGFSYGGEWTGIGYVAGPGTLIVEPGSDFTCASHLWVGQGTADQGTVIINGGTLHIPNGELGVSWNGIGGTNYITITNGATVYLRDWNSSTLGYPGAATVTNIGIMALGDSSQVIITNNALSFFPSLIASNQIVNTEAGGTIQYIYNPALNITVLSALPPKGPTTPEFSINPSNTIVGLGGTATLTASASPATGYQWFFNSAPLVNGSGVSGATTATLTIANFSAAETGSYSVVATNSAASPSDRPSTLSTSATLSDDSFSLFPVVTINGVNGSTYVTQYATTLSGPWTSFSTNTAGAGPILVVDTTSPLSIKKFYRVEQQ
jgi:hypothetical protein